MDIYIMKSFGLARALLLLLSCVLLLAGCGQAPVEPSPPDPEVKTYTVRGKVTQLPNPDRPGSELMVHHEMIPDFENAQGEVVGMNAMIMPFPLAEGVTLDGIEAGDVVEMTFEMRFKPKTYYEVTSISELAPDTELELDGKVGDDI